MLQNEERDPGGREEELKSSLTVRIKMGKEVGVRNNRAAREGENEERREN